MNEKSILGKIGEDTACEYLVQNGFQIIERNLRKPWGEIDIVAVSPDKTLVFVEVKTMKSTPSPGKQLRGKSLYLTRGLGGLKPEDQMTRDKLRKFKRSAMLYAGTKENLINDKKGWRLDLLALIFSEKSKTLTKSKNHFIIRHYKNIS